MTVVDCLGRCEVLDDVILQVNSTNNSARLSLGNRNPSGEVFISQDLMTGV